MASANYYFHGKRVSLAHKTILDEYERRHGFFVINQGRRTLAEQWVFWRIYQRDGWPIAAFPSASAPHIKANHENHALDINDGLSDRVAQFYRDLGVRGVVFNVRNEPWHIDFTDEESLIRVAHSLRARGGLLATLTPGIRHSDVLSLRYKLWDATGTDTSVSINKRYYGVGLAREVKKFQKAHGLTADGVVGTNTWKKLNNVAERTARGK